ncbi:MAG: Gfo/Idh/MocA family oxidoreductase [Oscillibacter sp.]|nr:Gfo/Idh/MocA family oxidoreductase [Oscillibacter sp.]
MGVKLAVVGCGAFCEHFVPLFRLHPLVERLTLCDRNDDKLDRFCSRFGVEERTTSYEEVLNGDYDAVALFTQPWLHASMTLDALRAGKHVWCCVPVAQSLDDLRAVAAAVEERQRIYYCAETSFYTPNTVFCRRMFDRGAFGRIVYAECEYYHDWDHGLYEIHKARGGKDWRKKAGSPPMWYPTHAISQVTSVTHAHPTHVSCMGYTDTHPDGIYRPGANQYGNVYSGETALYRMSDGSVLRHNEYRRIGHVGAIRFSLYGTDASFEDNAGAQVWVDKERARDVGKELACSGGRMIDTGAGSQEGFAPIHDVSALPRAYLDPAVFKGHSGSHPFLVHDFLTSIHERREIPNNNVWDAARTMLPGLVAHESCLQGGQLLPIPDLGDPRPVRW